MKDSKINVQELLRWKLDIFQSIDALKFKLEQVPGKISEAYQGQLKDHFINNKILKTIGCL